MARYYKMTLDGRKCIFDNPLHLVDELFEMIVNGEENKPITIQAVEMTVEQYEKTEEFEGW